MVAAAAPVASPNGARKKVRVDGEHTLSDVARSVCGDVRLAALIADLNPALPATGLLPAGTVVECPSRDEARVFARMMGFTLGFDPHAANGTDARRRWAAHQGEVPRGAGPDAIDMARALLARGVNPGEVGRRIARQCSEAQTRALLASAEPAARAVAEHAEVHLLFPRAVARLAGVRGVLDATLRPEGLRALLEGAARDAGSASALLAGAAIAPALRQAIVEEAPRVAKLLVAAREIASLEPGARDGHLAGHQERGCLTALVAACADGIEPLAGDRPALLGLGAEVEALNRHLEMLLASLRKGEEGLGRASVGVLRALVNGEDGSRLPRPWPLLASVCKALADAMVSSSVSAHDRGLGGLIKAKVTGRTSTGQVVGLALLRSRAVACAKAADEGDALAARLVPAVLDLFRLMRPQAAMEASSPRARRARDRQSFEHAVAAARGGIRGDGVAALASELIERVRLAGHPVACRLSAQQLEAIDRVARGMVAPMAVHRRQISELGRALVVVAMACDRELGLILMRPTGEEVFLASAARQAGGILSAAACRI